jgi:hypothetical protein
MAVYLLVLVDSGLVPDKDKLWTAEDGAYLDAAIRYALNHSLTEETAQ